MCTGQPDGKQMPRSTMALTEVVAAPTGQGLGTLCLAEQVWLQLDAQRLHARKGGEPEVAAGPGQLSCGSAQVAAQNPRGAGEPCTESAP